MKNGKKLTAIQTDFTGRLTETMEWKCPLAALCSRMLRDIARPLTATCMGMRGQLRTLLISVATKRLASGFAQKLQNLNDCCRKNSGIMMHSFSKCFLASRML